MNNVWQRKNWALSTVKKICQRVDQAVLAGSGLPKSTRSNTNIAAVKRLICSQEGETGQHSTPVRLLLNINCRLPTGFVFQQDGAACSVREWSCAKLSRFCCKRSLASKFAGSIPLGLLCVGCNVGGLSQTSNKAENNCQSQGSISVDLGQPTTETYRRGC